MKANDMPQFAALMNTLSEVYGREITEVVSEVYWNTLKRFKWVDVKRAVGKHIADPDKGQFMPKPADIIRWIEGTKAVKALQAWAKVTMAMRQVGVYESVMFDDPIIHSVIIFLGGWIRLCQVKTDDLSFLAQDFQKHYVALLNDPPHVFPPHVRGIFPSSKPVRIGNAYQSYPQLEHDNEKNNHALLEENSKKSVSV